MPLVAPPFPCSAGLCDPTESVLTASTGCTACNQSLKRNRQSEEENPAVKTRRLRSVRTSTFETLREVEEEEEEMSDPPQRQKIPDAPEVEDLSPTGIMATMNGALQRLLAPGCSWEEAQTLEAGYLPGDRVFVKLGDMVPHEQPRHTTHHPLLLSLALFFESLE